MSAIAVIPARGGSKGLVGKNKALLRGVSLVERSILAAKSVPAISRIVVSSDDEDIIAIAQRLKVEVVRRPKHLSSDNSPIEATITHALNVVVQHSFFPDALVLLQPTSPLRDEQVLADALYRFELGGCSGSVFGVITAEHHPAKMFRISSEELVPFTTATDLSRPRQELPQVVRQSGSLYIVGTKQFLLSQSLFVRPARWVEVSAEEAIDIDTSSDLDAAHRALHSRHC